MCGRKHSLPPALFPPFSLNRPLFTDKVRNHGRSRRVETDHIHHAAVVRVGEGEAVGGHTHNNRLRVADGLATILAQRLRRMDVACPRLAVRVGDEAGHIQLVAGSPQHRQRAVRAPHRDGFDSLDDFGQTHARREVHSRDTRFPTAPLAAVTTSRSRERDDFVLWFGRRRDEGHRRACFACRDARTSDHRTGHRTAHIEGEQHRLAARFHVLERRVERIVQCVHHGGHWRPLERPLVAVTLGVDLMDKWCGRYGASQAGLEPA